jgi:hypothetical protein
VGPYLASLPQQPMDNWLLGLLGPYHRYAIGTFNTCSRGPTHRSLTDTGGGCSLEDIDFSHTTFRSFQPTVSPLHLRAPSGLQFIQVLSTDLFSSYIGDGRRLGEHVIYGFWLLTSRDWSCYMVLQPHPLAFVCLTLVGFRFWLFYVLALCWWS